MKDNHSPAQGTDSLMKLGLYYIAFVSAAVHLLPLFYIPSLKYRLDSRTNFSMWQLEKALYAINATSLGRENAGSIISDPAMSDLLFLGGICRMFGILCSISGILTLIFFLTGKKRSSQAAGQTALTLEILICSVGIIISFYVNSSINILYGFENSFENLTLYSDFYVGASFFGMTFLSALLIWTFPRVMNTAPPRNRMEGKNIRQKTSRLILICLSFILAALAYSLFFMGNRGFYFTMFVILILSMLPFFIAFEKKRHKGRQIILIASIAVIATIGRLAFFALPYVKPLIAMVIIGAMALGPLAGFMIGSLTAILSNVLFGQGPWTPWQMLALGLIGYVSGLLFYRHGEEFVKKKFILSFYGFVCGLVIYGLIMDTFSAISVIDQISLKNFAARYASGFPVNLIHGTATGVFLWILGEPVYKKLARVKVKYGIFLGEEQEENGQNKK